MNDELEQKKYMIFKLADELYGSHLVSIKEIIKIKEIKPVPFMVHYFKGILNLRGQIISVIDLRLKLELPCLYPDQGLLIVVETDDGMIGAVVDDVVSVFDFEEGSIEKNLHLKTKIDPAFFIGVGKFQDRLVHIVDISKTLTSDDLSIIKKTKEIR